MAGVAPKFLVVVLLTLAAMFNPVFKAGNEAVFVSFCPCAPTSGDGGEADELKPVVSSAKWTPFCGPRSFFEHG